MVVYTMDLTHLITFLLLLPFGASVNLPAKERCFQCKFLVETFKIGMDLTKKAHFAGGNTDWEERKLGKFATSETRFIEVLESTCKKELLTESTEYEFIKDIKHKCHTLVEKHEELLEDWFLHKQEKESDLMNYFCLSELRSCCPSGHFGVACEPCPAVSKNLSPCFGRGQCDGEGIRDGTGKCKCDHGYVGSMCSNCDAHFYPVYQNDTAIECAECFDGCGGGCTAAGPKGCRSCRTGYIWDAEEGCKDIDECLETGKCTKDKEFCVNSIGSYRCECENGYRRNKDQECEIDIEAKGNQDWISAENLLKFVSYSGLFAIGLFIFYVVPNPKYFIMLIIAIAATFLIEYYYPKETEEDFNNDLI
jgi:hypothetical protein